MHLADELYTELIKLRTSLLILSAHAFPGIQTRDFIIASAMLQYKRN